MKIWKITPTGRWSRNPILDEQARVSSLSRNVITHLVSKVTLHAGAYRIELLPEELTEAFLSMERINNERSTNPH